MNSVQLTGTLVRDPELRYVGDRGIAKVTFTILNIEGKADKPKKNYIKCEGWAALAEQVAEQCRAGSDVQLAGQYTTDAWTDKTTGEKKNSTYVKVGLVTVTGSSQLPASRPVAQPTRVRQDDLPF